MNLEALKKEVSQSEEIVVRKLEHWAEVQGDKPFYYYGEEDKTLSFKEFNEITNSIAHHLQDMGIVKGDRVSLFIKNPFVSTLMMFGIWKAGGVYSPINFNYIGKLLSYQINDTAPTLLVTERQLVPIINDIKGDLNSNLSKVIVYTPDKGNHDFQIGQFDSSLHERYEEISFHSLLNGNKKNLDLEIKHWDTANIIYTSGTTGQAKGVVQSHRWIYVLAFNQGKIINQEDVIYSDLPLYHIGGAITNISRATFVGCKVAVWNKFSPNQFWDRIKISGSTYAVLVDVMIPWLMKAKETPDDHRNTLNKVYLQPLVNYHHEVAKRFGWDFIISGYGQTESGQGCFAIISELEEGCGTPPDLYKGFTRSEMFEVAEKYGFPIHHGYEKLNKGYMGKPSIFKEMAILDENDEECAIGEVGQIVFRPRIPYAIFTEYLGKPEATLEAVKNFWFHTGDAGYRDENGFFYFVDRMGTVIRVKGENISSYQVEDIIVEHPSIKLCAVFPIPAEEGEEDDIVTFVVLQDGEQVTEVKLQEWMKQRMPKYMRPKYIRFIDEIPRTPTNKIEKYKLKQSILSELNV